MRQNAHKIKQDSEKNLVWIYFHLHSWMANELKGQSKMTRALKRWVKTKIMRDTKLKAILEESVKEQHQKEMDWEYSLSPIKSSDNSTELHGCPFGYFLLFLCIVRIFRHEHTCCWKYIQSSIQRVDHPRWTQCWQISVNIVWKHNHANGRSWHPRKKEDVCEAERNKLKRIHTTFVVSEARTHSQTTLAHEKRDELRCKQRSTCNQLLNPST